MHSWILVNLLLTLAEGLKGLNLTTSVTNFFFHWKAHQELANRSFTFSETKPTNLHVLMNLPSTHLQIQLSLFSSVIVAVVLLSLLNVKFIMRHNSCSIEVICCFCFSAFLLTAVLPASLWLRYASGQVRSHCGGKFKVEIFWTRRGYSALEVHHGCQLAQGLWKYQAEMLLFGSC